MLNGTQKPQHGATLIEVAITMTVLAITAAYGLPGFMDWIQNSQLRTVAESVQSGLQLARSEAVRRNARVEFKLSDNVGAAGATGWTVRLVSTGATVQSKPDGESSAAIAITATPSGADTVTFEGTGRRLINPATNADGSAFLEGVGVDSTTLSAAESRELSVVIGAGGQIRMCDPNVSTTGDPRKC